MLKDFDTIKYYLKILCFNLLLFIIIYYPTNNLSIMTHNISFQWEQNIPFVDWMIIPYMSFNLLFIIPIFLLDKEQIRNLSYECTISTIFSGIIFLIFPVKLLFVREIPNGVFNKIYEYLFIIDQPQNLFPSLHIMYSLLLLLNCFLLLLTC